MYARIGSIVLTILRESHVLYQVTPHMDKGKERCAAAMSTSPHYILRVRTGGGPGGSAAYGSRAYRCHQRAGR
ncbi:hypothetical protein E2C01_050923 [Portunus trituberculatus]|uniref:Uncharacterized protein n=1 Tax=Portunus trituberculatus TaxID=210409 RepID=A0A5B7GHM2_PORTR|nr:hypothetical protein [Portunus trituberculatus]